MDVNHNITGNPNLKPEKSHNFQMSAVKKIIKKTNWFQPELAVFYNSISHRIVLSNIKDASYTYKNIDHFKAITANASCAYKFKIMSGSLGFSNTTASLEPSGFKNPINSFEITNNTSINIKKAGLTASLFIKVNGRAISYVSNEFGEAIKSTTPQYTWADITFSKPFYKEKWVIGFGIKNLLDIKTITANSQLGGVHNGNGNLLQLGMGRVYFLKLDFNFIKK